MITSSIPRISEIVKDEVSHVGSRLSVGQYRPTSESHIADLVFRQSLRHWSRCRETSLTVLESNVGLSVRRAAILSRYSFFISSYYTVLFTYVQLHVVSCGIRPFLIFILIICTHSPLVLTFRLFPVEKTSAAHAAQPCSLPNTPSTLTTDSVNYCTDALLHHDLFIYFTLFSLPLIFTIPNLLSRRSVLLETLIL